jgi:hypothetical protein
MPYPNVTVCFPKYFDSRLMQGGWSDRANFRLLGKCSLWFWSTYITKAANYFLSIPSLSFSHCCKVQ